VEYHLEDIELRGDWTGPCGPNLWSHALAPVAEPVLEIVSAMHLVTDRTLPGSQVIREIMKQSRQPGKNSPFHRLTAKL
jgi:acetoacetate decarboxylase